MSKRIVITSFGSFGDVYPYIGLGLALKARGHRPLLAMPGFYRERVESEGLEFRTEHGAETACAVMERVMG